MSTSKLPPHEWMIISLLILTVSLLTIVVFFNKKEALPRTKGTTELSSDQVQVTIKGAVTHAGTYDFKKGVRLKDLIALAEPVSDADMRGLKLNSKLRDGQVIKIAAYEWITIHLEGAVQEKGPMKLLKGTKLIDLLEKIKFSPDADIAKLKKNRPLKDGEVISVPTKKIPKAKLAKPSKNPN